MMKDTNQNGVIDGDEVYSFTYRSLPNETDTVAFSLDVELLGKYSTELQVNKVDESDTFLNDSISGYLGSAYDLHMNNKFEKANISFDISKLSEDITNTENFEPGIFYFNEETQMLEYVEGQVREGSVISAELTHFSKYILLNVTDYIKMWKTNIREPQNNDGETRKGVDVVLLIDSSGSMSSNDPSYIRKAAAKLFMQNLGEGDRGAVVSFTDYATTLQDLTGNKELLNSAIDNVFSSGGTSFNSGLSTAINLLSKSSQGKYKFIIMLSDGESLYSKSYTTTALKDSIVIYTIGLGRYVNETTLKSIATETKGKYYFAASAKELPDIFKDTAVETIDYTTDSNNDGISDYYTRLLCEGKLRILTGAQPFRGVSYERIQQDADYDKDGVINGKELILKPFEVEIFGYKLRNTFAYMYSDPTKIDTDGDEIEDCFDKAPSQAWNPNETNLGRIVSSAGFLYDPSQDIIYSKKNSEQRNLGFCYAYDEGIVAISSQLECEPVYFLYDGKEWMIELWKGQYGIEVGGEIGVYYRQSNDYRFGKVIEKNSSYIGELLTIELKNIMGTDLPDFIVEGIEKISRTSSTSELIHELDEMIEWINGDSFKAYVLRFVTPKKVIKDTLNVINAIKASLNSKLYRCVNASDYLKMSFTLEYDGNTFQRDSLNHWWLTGFRWGMSIKTPSDIKMNNLIEFKNKDMAEAFLYGRSQNDDFNYSSFTTIDPIYESGTQDDNDADNSNNNIYGLYHMNYDGAVASFNKVDFNFIRPFSVQPVTQTIFKSIINGINSALVEEYNALKTLLNIESNDPNEIYRSINDLCIHQDRINAEFYDAFYKQYKDEFRDYFGKSLDSVFNEENRQYVAEFLQYKLRQFTGKVDQIVNAAFRVAGGALK